MSSSTGSTGSSVTLNPLPLFLVTMRIPDEAKEDPVPEPAEKEDPVPDALAGPDFMGVYDLTGIEPSSRFQDIAGTTPSTDRIGRVVDLSGNNRDLTALDDAGRPKAQSGYALYDDYGNHRLASPAFDESGPETYVAVRFRQDNFRGQGNTLIARGPDNIAKPVALDQGNGNFRLFNNSGTILSDVNTSSGDHTLEVWAGEPARYSLDGGPILDTNKNWTAGLQRIVIGGRNIGVSNRSWQGRIYRAVFMKVNPSESTRLAVKQFLEP